MSLLRLPETALVLWLMHKVICWIEVLWREVVTAVKGAL
jgi:hypothetical protein